MPAPGPTFAAPAPEPPSPQGEGTWLDTFRTRLATIPGGVPRRPTVAPVAQLSVLGLLDLLAEGRRRRVAPESSPAAPAAPTGRPVAPGVLWQATRAAGVATGVLLCWQVLALLHLATPLLPWAVPGAAAVAVMALARRATTRELDDR